MVVNKIQVKSYGHFGHEAELRAEYCESVYMVYRSVYILLFNPKAEMRSERNGELGGSELSSDSTLIIYGYRVCQQHTVSR